MISQLIRMNEEQPGVAIPSGSEIKRKKVKFQVRATKGSEVVLAGSFNNWDPQAIKMKHAGNGSYARTISLPAGRHEYKFLVNDEWQIDMQCPNVVRNHLGTHNSVIEVA